MVQILKEFGELGPPKQDSDLSNMSLYDMIARATEQLLSRTNATIEKTTKRIIVITSIEE